MEDRCMVDGLSMPRHAGSVNSHTAWFEHATASTWGL